MKKAGLITLGISLFLWGCLEQINDLDKIQDYTWNPELALPISNTTFGIVEFLENDTLEDYIEVDQDGLIILTYEDQFESQDAASYVEIPDESYNESISFESPVLIQLPIQFQISKTVSYDKQLENEEGDEIDSVTLNSGSLELNLLANFPASGEVSFIFHSAFENGLPLERTYTWNYTGQQPVLDVTDIIDLSNFKFDLTDGGTTSNSFQFDVAVTLNYEGEAVLPENSLEIGVQLLDADFEAVYGNLATRSISSEQERINLDFFDNLSEGSFYLDEPRISLELENSYGIPIGIDLSNLSASNSTQTLNLSGSITTDQQIIDAPDINQVGETVNSTISIDHTNSNLPDLISLLPTEITYQLDGTINPGSVNQKSFVLGESIVIADLLVELPLIGRISNLKVEQEFDFEGQDVFDDFKYALFKITTENGFPLATEIQVYFLDQFGQTLDVLIEGDQLIVEAATVDSEGLVSGSTIKATEIEMNESKIEAVKDAQKLLLEARFSTSEDGNVSVKMLDSYELNIKLGVQTEFSITLDL